MSIVRQKMEVDIDRDTAGNIRAIALVFFNFNYAIPPTSAVL